MDSSVTLEIPRADTTDKYPRAQSERFVSASSADMAPVTARTFTIRSVRVDNQSNQWLRVGYEFDYIPPYTIGVIFNVRGMGSIGIVREVPNPIDTWIGPNNGISPDAIAGESYTLVLYDKPQMPSLGRPMVGKSALVFDSSGALNAPVQFVATHPIEIISVELQVTTSVTPGNRVFGFDIMTPADIQWRAAAPSAAVPAGSTGLIGFGQAVPATSIAVTATSIIQTSGFPVGTTMQPHDILRAREFATIDLATDTARMVILGKLFYPRP